MEPNRHFIVIIIIIVIAFDLLISLLSNIVKNPCFFSYNTFNIFKQYNNFNYCQFQSIRILIIKFFRKYLSYKIL